MTDRISILITKLEIVPVTIVSGAYTEPSPIT